MTASPAASCSPPQRSLAARPAWPSRPGTRVRLETDKGVILVELADDSADHGRQLPALCRHRPDEQRGVLPGRAGARRADGGPGRGRGEGPTTVSAHRARKHPGHGAEHLDEDLVDGPLEPGTAVSDFSIMCGEAPHLDAHPEAPAVT